MYVLAYARTGTQEERRGAVIKRMSAKEARDRFAEILGDVHYGKNTIIVEKQGKPMVAVIDVEWYERLTAAWDEPFKVLDKIWAKNQGKDLDQVQKDVAEAIAEVRAQARAKSRKRAS
jgi:prevent-host-death family protein